MASGRWNRLLDAVFSLPVQRSAAAGNDGDLRYGRRLRVTDHDHRQLPGDRGPENSDAQFRQGESQALARPCCKGGRFYYLDGSAGSAAVVLCGRDAVQLRPRAQSAAIDFPALAARLERHAAVTANEFLLRAQLTDGATPYEITLFPNGRAIIKGTQAPDVARGIYSKYIGI